MPSNIKFHKKVLSTLKLDKKTLTTIFPKGCLFTAIKNPALILHFGRWKVLKNASVIVPGLEKSAEMPKYAVTYIRTK